MSTTPPEYLPRIPDESDAVADRRRRWGVAAAAVLLPATLMVIGSLGDPRWGFVVIALLCPALWFVGRRRRQRSREGTDERARHIHRQSTAFSWQLMAVLLTAVIIWMDLRHGIRAAEPFLALGVALMAGYLGARLWLQWRDS